MEKVVGVETMKSEPGGQILVLDGDMVSALTVSRSLDRLGYSVVLASSEKRPLASYSNSIQQHFVYPDPLVDIDAFIDWIEQAANTGQYQLIIPVTERSLVPIKNALDRFPSSLIAMPHVESLDAVLDKAETFRVAESLNIPVPRGTEVTSLDQLRALDWLEFPVVIKPVASVASSGTVSKQLRVDYAFGIEELRSKASQYLDYGRVILQQRVAGVGVGVELLANHGEVLYAFQHQRLHEVPLTGGGSTLRQSVPLDSRLLEASKKLLKALHWHGVAMVEFKQDRDSGQFYIMEINGRFWGSLPLAVVAGADFPAMLVQMLLEGKTDFSQDYREGIVCRRLTSDVHWYELALRRAAPKELNVVPTKKRMLMDLILMFNPRHRFDVQRFTDPLPGLIEIAQLLQDYWYRFAGIVSDKCYYQSQRLAWRFGCVRKAIRNADNILFLCYGNINRSAIAELLARKVGLTERLSVRSAGFHMEGGRKLDSVMCDVVRNQGGCGDRFFSTCVTPELVDEADVIFVMEKRHHDDLLDKYPGCRARVFLLGGGAQDDVNGIVLPDPYGLPRDIYQKTYARVEQSINLLARWVGR